MKEITLKSYLALFSLAISAFAIGTTEFVIVGLLPSVATDLDISIVKSGYLISGYAISLAIGTPIITALTGKIPRKKFLLALMLIFVVGNLFSTLSVTFEMLMLSRIITAIAHGVYFAIAAVVAVDIVSANKKGTAVSILFTGLTVATVAGVPLGTFIGQHFGWRSAFLMVTILGIIGLLANSITIEKQQQKPTDVSLSNIIDLLKNRRIVLALLMTVFGFGSTFALFTYLVPILEDISGYSSSSVSILLLVYGVAVIVGNIIGGKLANQQPVKSLRWVFTLQALILVLQIWLLPSKKLTIIAILLLGIFAFMMSAGVQAYILILSEKLVPSATNIASALNISGFNLGIALGSTLGGIAMKNYNYLDTAWIGAVMAIGAFFLAVINYRLDKKEEIINEN